MKLYKRERFRTSKPEFDRWASVYEELSPAELDEILKDKLQGDSWVLGELKQAVENKATIDDRGMPIPALYIKQYVLQKMKDLESQIPRSRFAEQAEANKRKARVLDKLQKYIESLYVESEALSSYQVIHASLNKLKKLLAEEEADEKEKA